LNGVGKLLFNDINKSKGRRGAGFVRFWKTDLPLIMYLSRRAMLVSFVVFTVCFMLGVVTSIYNPEFAKTILSSGYIEMTNENIEAGDPMAVYKSDSEWDMFLYIFRNNVTIDFRTFFSGVFMSIGTLFIMITNGVMVGVFQYFFIDKGLFWESFLAIWTHGALEISTIILSGGAGLTLGKGLLFPGTYSRFQAFKISGMNGLKIILGVAPITLLAAFIESFLTRHTDIPDPIRFAFILLSFAFILAYFFWYPRKVAKQQVNINELVEEEPVYRKSIMFNRYEILGAGSIITQTLHQFFKKIGLYSAIMGVVALLFSILMVTDRFYIFRDHDFYFSFFHFFNFEEFPLLAFTHLLFFTGVLTLGLEYLKRHLINPSSKEAWFKSKTFVKTLMASLLTLPIYIGLIMIGNGWFIALACVILPLLIFMVTIVPHQEIGFFQAVSFTGVLLFYLAVNYLSNILLIENTLIYLLTNDNEIATSISLGISVFILSFSFALYFILSLIYSSILFYTLKESYSAEDLVNRISNIRSNK